MQDLLSQVEAAVAVFAHTELLELRDALEERGHLLVCIALPHIPSLPETLEEVLESQATAIAADRALYLNGLVTASLNLGIEVCHRSRGDAESSAAKVLRIQPSEIESFLNELGRELGPPWRKEHRDAAAAAIGTLGSYISSSSLSRS